MAVFFFFLLVVFNVLLILIILSFFFFLTIIRRQDVLHCRVGILSLSLSVLQVVCVCVFAKLSPESK